MPDTRNTEEAVRRYADMVWHICVLQLRNRADADDAFQNTFLRYLEKAPAFNDPEHEKAWIARVAINICKDHLKSAHRKDGELPDEHGLLDSEGFEQPGSRLYEVFDLLKDLPDNHKLAIYLTAVHGYTADEVARIMDATPNTVYSWVSRARQQLKEAQS